MCIRDRYKGFLFKGEAVPFVMELPNYRLPSAKNVIQLLWEKAKDFLEKAFTVILVATVAIWFLQSFDWHFDLVADSQDSILAAAAGWIAPLLAPLGLGDWRICTSLISGFIAKESVASTLEILYAGGVANALTPLAAATLLVFSLLYTPCIAAIASVKRELGWKWAAGMVVWQCGVAWTAALCVRAVGLLPQAGAAMNWGTVIAGAAVAAALLLAVGRIARNRRQGRHCGGDCGSCGGCGRREDKR